MNPNTIISVLSSLEEIGGAEREQQLRESIIKMILSLVDQINSINSNQMKEISEILTRFEWIQYITIGTAVLGFLVLGYINYRLWKKLQQFESKK